MSALDLAMGTGLVFWISFLVAVNCRLDCSVVCAVCVVCERYIQVGHGVAVQVALLSLSHILLPCAVKSETGLPLG